jgi:hypothetical protein
VELREFESMWTIDAWKYVLQRHEDGYLPIDISGGEPMAVLIDEDDALAEAVAQRMLAAGVRVVDLGDDLVGAPEP